MLRVPGFAGGHASGGAGVAEDGAQDAADSGIADGAFGGVAAGGEQGDEGALVEMERVGLRCANPAYRVDVRLLVVENLVQRIGFQYTVCPDVYLLGGGLFQALMHVARQGAEAVIEQTD